MAPWHCQEELSLRINVFVAPMLQDIGYAKVVAEKGWMESCETEAVPLFYRIVTAASVSDGVVF